MSSYDRPGEWFWIALIATIFIGIWVTMEIAHSFHTPSPKALTPVEMYERQCTEYSGVPNVTVQPWTCMKGPAT